MDKRAELTLTSTKTLASAVRRKQRWRHETLDKSGLCWLESRRQTEIVRICLPSMQLSASGFGSCGIRSRRSTIQRGRRIDFDYMRRMRPRTSVPSRGLASVPTSRRTGAIWAGVSSAPDYSRLRSRRVAIHSVHVYDQEVDLITRLSAIVDQSSPRRCCSHRRYPRSSHSIGKRTRKGRY
jgi:hypothetical protein